MEDEDDPDSDKNKIKDFKCRRCGFCCQLDVALMPEDIVRIRSIGKKGFYKERSGENILKKR